MVYNKPITRVWPCRIFEIKVLSRVWFGSAVSVKKLDKFVQGSYIAWLDRPACDVSHQRRHHGGRAQRDGHQHLVAAAGQAQELGQGGRILPGAGPDLPVSQVQLFFFTIMASIEKMLDGGSIAQRQSLNFSPQLPRVWMLAHSRFFFSWWFFSHYCWVGGQYREIQSM